LHERALRAGARIEGVLLAQSLIDDPAPRPRDLVVQLEACCRRLCVAPDPVLEQLTEGRGLGGCVGLVRIPDPFDLAGLPTDRDDPPLLLVAVDVEEPGNVGALVRTALASGADGFIGTGLTDPYHPKAVRTSMGSLFKLPLACHRDTMEWIRSVRRAGLQTVGATTASGIALPLAAFSERGSALFVGSEAFGLEAGICSELDLRVTIPMVSEVDSYAVNAAAAIALYEIRRQRMAG